VDFVIILAVLALAVWVLAGPLRPGRVARVEAERSAEEADLDAAREVKYREIRDLELDFRTGKVAEEDYRAADRALRAEAVEILRRLDRLRGEAPPPE
jgi:hypothetical protein